MKVLIIGGKKNPEGAYRTHRKKMGKVMKNSSAAD
jgi:hypothetical protein